MSSNSKYNFKTLLLGFIGVPLLVSIPAAFVATATAGATEVRAWGVLGVALMTALMVTPIWYAWGRRVDRPAGWVQSLWPVLVPAGYYVLAWAITFGVVGLVYGDTLNVAIGTHAPYFLLIVWILLIGVPAAVPVVLLVTLVSTMVGFLLGCRKRPIWDANRGSLVATLAGVLVLALIAAGQMAQSAMGAASLGDGATVSQEVDLYRYRPFEPDNQLVAVDPKPRLQIKDNYPVLDGATAAYPIYGAMAQAMYQLPPGLTDDQRWEFVTNYLDCTNTSGGYEKLIAGTADVFFGAQPSKTQKEAAAAAGVELKLTPIGREAFVIFVNQDNPVSNLTTAQVRDVYTRRVTNWAELGGPDEAILAFQRPADSGSQTVMLAKVMQGEQMSSPLKEEIVSGMGGIVSQVAEFRNSTAAIGYSFRWYATVMNGNPGIKLLAIDGVEPTVDNIRNGSYPFTIDVYAVTARTTNPNAAKIVDWITSDEGQKLIEKVGYVGLK